MKQPATLIGVLAALVLAPGCTIGLPHGPIEPSITADCLSLFSDSRAANPKSPQVANAPNRRQQPHRQAKQTTASKAPVAAKRPVSRPAASKPVEHQTVQYEGEYQQELRPDDLAVEPPAAASPLPGHCMAPTPCFDPGPPGRFLPVPVRPAFSPRGPRFGCY